MHPGRYDPSTFDSVRRLIRTRLMETGAPSCVVGVAHHGEITWAEGFGWADRENRIAASEHIMYPVASTTKPFTATAIMILHEQGTLDIDRPVNDYVGPSKLRARIGDINHVTVRSLISHTSGLPPYVQFFYEDEPYPCLPLEQTILRYGEIMDEPGARFTYTNLGYAVLTYLIEYMSGLSYPDFLHQHIFLPLGMHRSSIGSEPHLAQYQARAYANNGLPYPDYRFDHLGGSALCASVHDLLRFACFHLSTPLADQRPILSGAAIIDMQRRQVAVGSGVYYGTGWFICDNGDGQHIIEHGGGMPGIGSEFVLLPNEELAIAVIVNGFSKSLHRDVTRSILSLLVPAYARYPSVAQALQVIRESDPLKPLLGEWSGVVHTYTGQIPFKLWVKDCGDVVAQVDDQLRTLVNNVIFKDGYLTGSIFSSINTSDASRASHHLELNFKLRNCTLSGALMARSNFNHGRDFFTLPYWTELIKT